MTKLTERFVFEQIICKILFTKPSKYWCVTKIMSYWVYHLWINFVIRTNYCFIKYKFFSLIVIEICYASRIFLCVERLILLLFKIGNEKLKIGLDELILLLSKSMISIDIASIQKLYNLCCIQTVHTSGYLYKV